MAGWLQAALRAVLPHVGDIIAAGKPAFTRREAANQDLVQQQIAELQGAVSQQAAQAADERLRRVLVFTAVAEAVAVASLGIAFIAVMTR